MLIEFYLGVIIREKIQRLRYFTQETEQGDTVF